MYKYEIRLQPTNENMLNSFLCFYAPNDDDAGMIIQSVCAELTACDDYKHDTEFIIKTISVCEV